MTPFSALTHALAAHPTAAMDVLETLHDEASRQPATARPRLKAADALRSVLHLPARVVRTEVIPNGGATVNCERRPSVGGGGA